MAGITKTYTGITTTGMQAAIPAPGGRPFNRYALQLKGVGGTLTSWSAQLEGSIDSTNWTIVAGPHTTPDGATVWAVDKPSAAVRVNLTALSLGTVTSVTIGVIAAGD
jgi:hypothetical protein